MVPAHPAIRAARRGARRAWHPGRIALALHHSPGSGAYINVSRAERFVDAPCPYECAPALRAHRPMRSPRPRRPPPSAPAPASGGFTFPGVDESGFSPLFATAPRSAERRPRGPRAP
ncbi:hypothetical protein AB1Y20_023056 [Prymnesium parvum]|uniref:Uncharacterized protein n=1 Tax=Prymnesium parvum TaxID=97485 RepID=A0AB34JFL0_PRYPA